MTQAGLCFFALSIIIFIIVWSLKCKDKLKKI